jgi:hypothetical protein
MSKRDEVTEEWRKLHKQLYEEDGACGMYEGHERCMQGFCGDLRERTTWKI